MTTQERECIKAMRLENYSYAFIGQALDLSPNTVKSVCQRHGYEAKGPRKTKAEKATVVLCKNCHKPLPNEAKPKAVFCSDRCRSEWRRENRKVKSTLDCFAHESDE